MSHFCGKCREKNLSPYITFFDLTKAFDTINQEALWRVLLHFGCTTKFDTFLHLLHGDVEVMVMTNGSTSDPFPIQGGVKQSYVIATTLLSIDLTALLHLTIDKLPIGVERTYRTSRKLFNLHHFHTMTKVAPTCVIKLQYADDAYVCTISEDGPQTIISAVTG
eukprot:g33693.t1